MDEWKCGVISHVFLSRICSVTGGPQAIIAQPHLSCEPDCGGSFHLHKDENNDKLPCFYSFRSEVAALVRCSRPSIAMAHVIIVSSVGVWCGGNSQE